MDVVQDYLNAMTIKCDNEGNPLIPLQHNSVSHVNNARSAFVHLCKPLGLSDTMKDMIKGKLIILSRMLFIIDFMARGLLEKMSSSVACGNMENTASGLKATDVSPNVMLANRLPLLEGKCVSLETTVRCELPDFVCKVSWQNVMSMECHRSLVAN